MRKLMMAAFTVAALGLTVGCQDRSKVQSEQQDVAEAQRDVAQENQNAQQEVAEASQDAQKDVADAQKDLRAEEQDLAQAQQQQATEQNEATGGSGLTNEKTEEVKGTIKSASANSLTLIVPDKDNKTMKFQADKQVQVLKDDKPVALSDLKAGDEVRASYQLDANGQMVLRSIEVEKLSAQHPEKQKK